MRRNSQREVGRTDGKACVVAQTMVIPPFQEDMPCRGYVRTGKKREDQKAQAEGVESKGDWDSTPRFRLQMQHPTYSTSSISPSSLPDLMSLGVGGDFCVAGALSR